MSAVTYYLNFKSQKQDNVNLKIECIILKVLMHTTEIYWTVGKQLFLKKPALTLCFPSSENSTS